MRLSLSRALTLVCLVAATVLTWFVLRRSHAVTFTRTCHHPKAFQDALHELAFRSHRVLSALGLTHFLCYGALWGQIRLSRSLPWESDVEFCLLNEEVSTHDEVFVARAFRRAGLRLAYEAAEGRYRVADAASSSPARGAAAAAAAEDEEAGVDVSQALVQLVVFEQDPLLKVYRRVGWKRRVLPPDCEVAPSLHCFPLRLVAPPLPKREFGGHPLPVPREGIELQKYHFQDNWWKVVTPKNC